MLSQLLSLAVLAVGLGPVELTAESFAYDSARPAAGAWLGNVELGGAASPAWIEVAFDGDWAVSATVPGAGAINDGAGALAIDGRAVGFELNGGALRFAGTISDDGRRLTGTVAGDDQGTFELARTPRPGDLAEPLSYSGHVQTPRGGPLAMSLVLAETPGGNWVGRMRLAIPGVGELPVYNIVRTGDALSAEVPVRGGGVLALQWDDAERSAMSGALRQGPLRMRVELKRGAAEPAAPEPPEAALGNWAESSWMIRRQVARPWALAGADVIDVVTGEVRRGVNVIITGDVIAAVSADPVPDGVRVVDAAGRYVIPGLFDLHAHIQPFTRDAEPDSDESRQILMALLDHGVTAVRALPLYTEFGLGAAAAVADGSVAGPMIVPAGGILEMRPQRTSAGFGDPDTARRWVERDALLGAQWIKVYNAMDEPSLAAIVEAAHRHGRRVCGHTEEVPPAEASRIGIDSIEHMVSIPLSAMPPGAGPPRGLGLTELVAWRWANADGRLLDELMDLFLRNGTAWVPTLVVTEQMVQHGSHDGGPAMAAEYEPALREALRSSARLAVSMHRKGGLVGLGTDFPIDGVEPGVSAHREMQLLVELGGASPLEALQIATIGSARILGYETMIGRVEPGAVANLVMLSENPLSDISATRSIELVVHEGREHRP